MVCEEKEVLILPFPCTDVYRGVVVLVYVKFTILFIFYSCVRNPSKGSDCSKSRETTTLVGGLEHFLFSHILGIGNNHPN